MTKIFTASLLFLLCFFPYIQILPLKTDTQPNALFLSSFIFIIIISFRHKIKIPIDFWIYGFIFICACVLSLNHFDFNSARSLMNYLSIFVISSVTYILLKKYGFPYTLLDRAILIWFIVGFVQTFIYRDFLTFLGYRASGSGSGGRGVVALAPEPTFYGLISSALLALYFINRPKGRLRKREILLSLVSIFIFSKSSTVILLLVLTFVLYISILALSKGIKYFIFLFLLGMVLTLFISNINTINSGDRIIGILKKIVKRPEIIFVVDGSVNERFIHAFFPLKGLFDNYFAPHGFNKFAEYMAGIYSSGEYAAYIPYYRAGYTRIMSGYGSIFFEIGFLGLYIFYSINRQFLKLTKIKSSNIFSLILFNLMLFMGLPFMTAVIPFMIGNIFYLNSRRYAYS